MTQTIEQLTARVRELEEENARLKEIEQTNDTLLDQLGDKNAALLDEVASQKHCYAEAVAHYEKQLAASQAYAEQLLEALEKLATIANQYAGHYPYQVATIVDAALSTPTDTSALDAYVSEKGVDHGWIHHNDWYDLCNKYSDAADKAAELCMKNTELTRQRDLAVEALKKAVDMVSHPDNIALLQQAIKESEGK